ncbi:MAG TPA: FtsX-like permease family protein, partial [Roseivirga sp.]
VSGVFQDVPDNSTEQFEFVLPFTEFETLLTTRDIHWGNYNALTYVQVAEGTDIDALNNKLKGFVKEKVDWSNVQLFLKPFSDRYLYSKYENGVQSGGRIEYVRLFSIVSIVILLIACINFINLSTAKASRRAKEIGVKKALVAQKGTLTWQYFQEATIISFISTSLAIVLVLLLLPQFNSLTGKAIFLEMNGQLILILSGVTVVTGLVAGSYPAIFLSSLKPVAILKGKLNVSFGDKWIRQGLVVFQFVLSVILICSILVVSKQIQFIQNKNLGYSKDNLILITSEGKIASDLEVFLEGLKNIPGVENAGGTVHTILNGGSYTTGLSWPGANPEIDIRFGNMTVTHNFIETLGVELLDGRSFSKEIQSDREALVLNEKAVEVMDLEDPIGQEVNLWGNDVKIIGVVKDFNFSSLHEAITPMFFRLGDGTYSNILIRIKGGSESSSLQQIEELYAEFNPNYEFNYSFLDQEYAKLYLAEQRVSTLTKYFGTLAILISCLGLFGLTIFTTETRIKEISVRKVLGCGSWRIVTLLTKQFSLLVGIAIIIALPMSYWAANQWLQDYAYKIDLNWWFFGLAGLLTLGIAWLTVASQTYKTARMNPAHNLRNE